jgi:hypothetical protein
LHWPRLFLASNGFARLEINYARIIGTAYPTFDPFPSETELQSFIQEYWKNYLLFLYEVDGQLWGQWDTRQELLPRYKTAADRRSPSPPEPAFTDWKKQYRQENNRFPKCFQKISETFPHGVGVGVGVGKNLCASKNDARVGRSSAIGSSPSSQETWFLAWWAEYWLRRGKKEARIAFFRHVKTQERFEQVLAATKAQKAEMLGREPKHRPYGSTWLNGERWEDEATEPTSAANQDDYPELKA